ncbi:MAG: hypothetical protein EXR73_01240 [Myxococcales bacterium]|nr:hypothetical protein [Myxococcales bacterium]
MVRALSFALAVASLTIAPPLLAAQNELWTRFGNDRIARVGHALAWVGDLNRDGADDYAVGTTAANTLLREVSGPGGASFGHSIARAGDFDGDAIPDLIVGAPLADNEVGAAVRDLGSRWRRAADVPQQLDPRALR